MLIDKKTEELVRKEIPGTWNVFVKYDQLATQRGAELSVRDTDHYNYPLRFYISNDTDRELYDQLFDEVRTTCCRCGSRIDVENRHIFGSQEWIEKNYLCFDCYVKDSYTQGGLYNMIWLKSHSFEIGRHYLDKKVRISLPNGDLHYVKIENLISKEGRIYLMEKNNTVESDSLTPVTILGEYTGIRDVTRERVYSKDYILYSYDGRKYNDSFAGFRKYDYCLGIVEDTVSMFSKDWSHKEWCVANIIDGFFPRPWHCLTNPIVFGSMGIGKFVPRKIKYDLFDSWDEEERNHIITNIRRVESDFDVEILQD